MTRATADFHGPVTERSRCLTVEDDVPEFIGRVSQKGGLDRQHAEVATQAVLSVLGETLSDREIKHLSSQLAKELKPMLQNVLGNSRAYTGED